MPRSAPSLRLFAVAYALLVAGDIAADLGEARLAVYLLKPLIVGSLIVWTLRHPEGSAQRGGRALLIGLCFALLGDVLLMVRGVDLFVFGLAAFLAMQVAYLVAFLQSVGGSGRWPSRTSALLRLLPFAGWATLLLLLLAPAFASAETAPLWWPVVVYGCLLCLMAYAAALRCGAVSRAGGLQVLLGAVLFVASDSLLALDRFLSPLPAAALLVMGTYAAAQWLIVHGFLRG